MTSFGCENGIKVKVRSRGLRRKDIVCNSRSVMTTLLTEEREREPGPVNNLTKKLFFR